MSATGPTTPGETCEVGGCELPSRGVAFTNAGDDFRSCGTPNHGRDFRPDAGGGGESGCPPECPNRLGPTCAHRRNYGITSAPALPVGGDAEGLADAIRAARHRDGSGVTQSDYARTLIAEAILAAGWKSPDEVAAIAREAAERALVEAADALNVEAVDFQPGWGSNELDQAKLWGIGKCLTWLQDRAASIGDGSQR